MIRLYNLKEGGPRYKTMVIGKLKIKGRGHYRPQSFLPLFDLKAELDDSKFFWGLRNTGRVTRATYRNAKDKFTDIAYRGFIEMRFRNVDYYIGSGFIGEKIGTPGAVNNDSDFVAFHVRPLVIMGCDDRASHKKYVRAAIQSGLGIDSSMFTIYVDPLVNTPKSKYQGAKFLLNKHIREKWSDIRIEDYDLSQLIPTAKMPTFRSQYQKDLTLRKVGREVMSSISI